MQEKDRFLKKQISLFFFSILFFIILFCKNTVGNEISFKIDGDLPIDNIKCFTKISHLKVEKLQFIT